MLTLHAVHRSQRGARGTGGEQLAGDQYRGDCRHAEEQSPADAESQAAPARRKCCCALRWRDRARRGVLSHGVVHET
jgi:hypothetical protein